MINIIFLIEEIIFVLSVYYETFRPISGLILNFLMIHASYERGWSEYYHEIIDEYPSQDCVKPKWFKFVYKKVKKTPELQTSGKILKDIPKELYYEITIAIFGSIIYYVLAAFLIFIAGDKKSEIVDKFSLIHMAFFVLSFLFTAHLIKKKIFLAKFKLLNRHNIKYFIIPSSNVYPRTIGKCHIIDEYKRRNKTFTTVKVLETGEVKEKVLLPGNKRIGKDPVYCLLEIGKVYYIV